MAGGKLTNGEKVISLISNSLIIIIVSYCFRWKQKVSLEDLQPSHLILYEEKLMPMIMAHCHYSLRAGEELMYRYDFQALEKQFLNVFVYGKPRIEVKELPHMVYRKDVYTAQKFEEIERKVPQVRIWRAQNNKTDMHLHHAWCGNSVQTELLLCDCVCLCVMQCDTSRVMYQLQSLLTGSIDS